MNFNNNKIDDDLCKNLIENQDLLLSSNANENDLGIDFFSMMNTNLMSECVADSSTIDYQQQLVNDNLGFKDEIIDSDLFEILRSEDPDVVSLIESLSNSDPTFRPDYLPQVSVNTTNKILNESAPVPVQPQVEQEPTKFSIVSLDDVFKKESYTPPPQNQPTQSNASVTPSRVSLRLIKRRNNGQLNKKNKDIMVTTKPKRELKRLGNHKRKISVDEDGSESGSVFSIDSSSDHNMFKSNNSVGYESDEHIYFDDDDFTSIDHNENSNEREFQQFVLNYNQQKKDLKMKLEMQMNDPTKKDANKEAATRYRLKKLSEKDQMFETRMLLEKENGEIKRRCELVQTEINYLKNILVQMLLTKGVIGEQMI